ncbi:uncharacterized protein Lmpt isoform X2 [Fopius arisanus]|uniref:Uncharacterized protein Lmpt isoform X2 n=1 Tax=Fopius arisanus TaxID=64838 RepID=A0A9R1U9U8_9HYME|nr:PREDICTED: uncharacterized protein LOC105272189 isoform X2 [Fopius arisanus]
MGLMLSILVGCVGVIELLTALKQVTTDAGASPAPCLSYHDSVIETPSFHDSICGITHSGDIRMPRSARNKLENLHEYSIRVRSELRCHGYGDGSTLSEISSRDALGLSRPDSRLSMDFDHDVIEGEVQQTLDGGDKSVEEVIRPECPLTLTSVLPQKPSASHSSTEFTGSFNDSEDDLDSKECFDCQDDDRNYSSSARSSLEEHAEITRRLRKKRVKKSEPKSMDLLMDTILLQGDLLNSEETRMIHSEKFEGLSSSHKRPRAQKSGSAVLRKPTRLKSRNAEISKSAENLSRKETKRQRDPDRRKSDISVQTLGNYSFRDEWTNTSPTDSEGSISASRSSVSVHVQTNFDGDDEFTFEALRSKGIRDIGLKQRNGRKSFRSKRFPKSRSLDDPTVSEVNCQYDRNIPLFEGHCSDNRRVQPFGNSAVGLNDEFSQLSLDNGDESIDEEFLDAEDVDQLRNAPIQYCIPHNQESNKAFWLIFSGEYTKAMNKDWHSGHFCCWQCDESLTGQRYVLRDEHPYCIKCYESIFANGCEECNKIIGIDSKDLSYKDKHWHEACFLCHKCRVSLVDKQFGSKVDKIYCGNCYDAQFASRCDGCGEIFRAGTKKMEYKTRQWHEKCFCCVVCKNPIGLKSFIPREQEIYCAGCYEDKFATRCVKCNKIITSGGVTYKNEPWHRDCFTCTHCNNSLAGQRFTSRDDKPYCAECFGELFAKRCTSCAKPITGIGGTRFISFEDRHWHNDCFICAGCKTSLVGRGFITDAEDIICPECAKAKLTTE